MDWSPASVKEVEKIIQADLGSCTEQERVTFERYAVPLFTVPILRFGKIESVVVVARDGDEVLYWEDVEEGFNTSSLTKDGLIAERFCNQDNLGAAIARWLSNTPADF